MSSTVSLGGWEEGQGIWNEVITFIGIEGKVRGCRNGAGPSLGDEVEANLFLHIMDAGKSTCPDVYCA